MESKACSVKRIRGIHIDSKDYLLIFNYTTKTIELYTRVVDIKQCFIQNNIVGKNPIVGHNNPYLFEFDVDIRFPIDEKNGKALKIYELYTPEEWLKIRLNRINKKLYKNPRNKIDQKDLFFEEIETVSGITVFGWSMGRIDIPHMDAVMEHTRLDIPMTIVYYDLETRGRFERYFENRPGRVCHVRYMTWDDYETRDV